MCARCCEPLELSQARWNMAFWGMAHRRCTAAKSWPPKFRPPMNPNEVLRQIHALCAYLGKMTSGMPLHSNPPQHKAVSAAPEQTQPRPAEDAEVEQKFEEKKKKVATPRKRPDRPTSTPKTTPSPTAKDARKGTRQAPTVSQAKTQTPKQRSRKQSTTSTSSCKPTTPRPGMREYELQNAIKAAGGKTIVAEEEGNRQIRILGAKGDEIQMALVHPFSKQHVCQLYLGTWSDHQVSECDECGARVARGDLRSDSFRSWECQRHEGETCMNCVPVVLRTEFVDE